MIEIVIESSTYVDVSQNLVMAKRPAEGHLKQFCLELFIMNECYNSGSQPDWRWGRHKDDILDRRGYATQVTLGNTKWNIGIENNHINSIL